MFTSNVFIFEAEKYSGKLQRPPEFMSSKSKLTYMKTLTDQT